MGTAHDGAAAQDPETVGTVGFIGAGRIGEPMVERLLAAGHDVRVYARRPEIRDRLSALGAEFVDRPRDIATADVVVSCLYSDAQVLEVLPDVVRAMAAGTVLVSHTTGTATTSRLDEFSPTGRAAIVDAPFSGTAESVRSGVLTVFLGGDPRDVAVARRVVGAYASPVIPVGARGSGMTVKLLNNLLFAAISQVTLRGLEAGRALGVEEETLLEALSLGSGGTTAGRYIASRGGSESFAAAVAPFLRKDLLACREVAADADADLSALFAVAEGGPMNLGMETILENGVNR